MPIDLVEATIALCLIDLFGANVGRSVVLRDGLLGSAVKNVINQNIYGTVRVSTK